MSPGWPDAPDGHPPPAPCQAQAVACLFPGQALTRASRSFPTHTHICDSINITLTRSLFDDRSESAWHFLNNSWHCEAGSRSWLQPGATGERGLPGWGLRVPLPLLLGWGSQQPGWAGSLGF